jgi:hypothetical protein
MYEKILSCLKENDEQLVLKYHILIQLRMLIYFTIVKHTCCGILFLSIQPTPILEQSRAYYLYLKETTISSIHAELLALHEASRKCVWLRSMIQHIQNNCGLSSERKNTTIIYEDNTACIAQLKEG